MISFYLKTSHRCVFIFSVFMWYALWGLLMTIRFFRWFYNSQTGIFFFIQNAFCNQEQKGKHSRTKLWVTPINLWHQYNVLCCVRCLFVPGMGRQVLFCSFLSQTKFNLGKFPKCLAFIFQSTLQSGLLCLVIISLVNTAL